MLQHLQTCEWPRLKHITRHLDATEERVQLFCAALRVPVANKSREERMNFVETNSVTARVGVRRPEAQAAIGENARDNLRDFAHSPIMSRVADIQNLVVDDRARCREHMQNGFRDVESVDQRTPR